MTAVAVFSGIDMVGGFMKWFKAPDIRTASVNKFLSQFGYEGLGMLYCVLNNLNDSGNNYFDDEDLVRWLRIHYKTANKILPSIRQVLGECSASAPEILDKKIAENPVAVISNPEREIRQRDLINTPEEISDAKASGKKPKKSSKPKEPDHPQASELVKFLTTELKTRGVGGIFSTPWYFANMRIANDLLKAVSLDELKQAIPWLLDYPYGGAAINSLTKLREKLPIWQREKSKTSRDQIVPHTERKGGTGKL